MERLTKKGGLDFTDKNLSLVDELGYSYIYNRLAEFEDKLENGQLQEVKNEPLTVEELKALEYGDWVWIVILKKGQYHDFSDMGYYEKSAMFDSDERFVGWRGYGTCFLYEYYGVCWIAYKNKEQAEAKLRELREKK